MEFLTHSKWTWVLIVFFSVTPFVLWEIRRQRRNSPRAIAKRILAMTDPQERRHALWRLHEKNFKLWGEVRDEMHIIRESQNNVRP